MLKERSNPSHFFKPTSDKKTNRHEKKLTLEAHYFS